MTRVRVSNFSMSLDGYAAGPDQSLERPMGVGGERLHEWAFTTRTFREMFGQDGGSNGIDEEFAAKGRAGIGATVMGRNMFGPVRGEWPDSGELSDWTGWWGPEPPYGHRVFVLTHHAKPDLEMAGGTTFHFVTDGLEAALTRARAAAGDLDVLIGGGTSTVRQGLSAGQIDEAHVAVVPTLLGGGESVFAGLDVSDTYAPSHFQGSGGVTHVVLTKR